MKFKFKDILVSNTKQFTEDLDDTNNEEDNDVAKTDKDDIEVNQPQDVGSAAKREGFIKSKKNMFAFGSTRPVTLLTKNEKLGGLDLTLQYVINPKTGAWSLRACLAGQTNEDMVEFETGEDPSSLVKNIQKKTKITPHQAIEFLNPPLKSKKDDVTESSKKNILKITPLNFVVGDKVEINDTSNHRHNTKGIVNKLGAYHAYVQFSDGEIEPYKPNQLKKR